MWVESGEFFFFFEKEKCDERKNMSAFSIYLHLRHTLRSFIAPCSLSYILGSPLGVVDAPSQQAPRPGHAAGDFRRGR